MIQRTEANGKELHARNILIFEKWEFNEKDISFGSINSSRQKGSGSFWINIRHISQLDRVM
jgi:hypothetical protein